MAAVFQKQHRRFERSDVVEFIRQAMGLHVDCEVIAPTIQYFDNPTEGLVVKNDYGRYAISVEEIERFPKHRRRLVAATPPLHTTLHSPYPSPSFPSTSR